MTRYHPRIAILVLSAVFALTVSHSPAAEAATYYVATTGNDKYPGTETQPWRTIQRAANLVKPGDRVLVQPGVYDERIVMKTSGTSNAPIIFEGTRSASGEWLSIIDGSDPVTAQWEPDPDLARVYRARLPYEPYAMMLDGSQCASNPDDCSKTIWRIGTDAMHQRYTFAPGQSNASRAGWPSLTQEPDAELIPYSIVKTPIKYWDGIEALFGYYKGYTYLRFRNGDDPNSKKIRISPGPVCQFCLPTIGAFTLDGANYVTVSSFRIRGARNGALLQRGASHNTIEHNHISGGQTRVRLDSDATANEVRFNVLRTNHVSGWLPGARTESLTYAPYERVVNWNLYFVNKFTVGDSAEDDRGVFLWKTGPGNTVHHNEMFEGAIGVQLLDKADQAQVYSNRIHHMSCQGIFLHQGIMKAEIFENLLYDNGINIRIQELDLNNQEIYIYRNRLWNPYGEQVFLNAERSSTSQIFFYHNSFSSPFRKEILGSSANDRVVDINVSGRLTNAANLVLVNNIFGSMREYGAEKLGIVASNLMPPGYVLPGNTAYQPKPWGNELPSFTLDTTSQARDKGIDLSKPFIIQGRSFAPLPGMTPAGDGKPDIGAHEYAAGRVSAITAPTNLRRIP